jgi:hypothetical protein
MLITLLAWHFCITFLPLHVPIPTLLYSIDCQSIICSCLEPTNHRETKEEFISPDPCHQTLGRNI